MIFTVEVPVSEHNRPEVKEAKVKEIKNLEYYETFEMVEDVRQEMIGSCWVVTKKEKHDAQNTEYKARLVARGFQEADKPQSDSSMVTKESLKLLIALVAKEDFGLVLMDIRAAFCKKIVV